jgi:phage anti-repressor protein
MAESIGITFSEELQTQMFGSDKVDFPIDFDDAWVWLEYSRKNNAVRALVSELDQGVDYLLINEQHDSTGGFSDSSATKPIKYYLSVDGFKMFCMAAGTKRGKEVRRYFVEVEKAYKQHVTEQVVQDAFKDAPPLRVDIHVQGNQSAPKVARTGIAKQLQALRCEIRAIDTVRHSLGLERAAKMIAVVNRQIDAVLADDAPQDNSTPEAQVPHSMDGFTNELVQSSNGLHPTLWFKQKPVYLVPPLPIADRIASLETTIHPDRDKPLINAAGRFVIREALRKLLAVVPVGIHVDGACLAPGIASAALIDNVGLPRLQKLIGGELVGLGFKKPGEYTRVVGDTRKICGVYVRVSEGQNNAQA